MPIDDWEGEEQNHTVLTVRDAARDIAFGSIAGMVSEIFEYPFDLAKVRLQAQLLTPSSSSITKFDGPMDCLLQTWKDEGVRGLYRGLPAPIVGAMAETAALFVAYTSFQNLIRSASAGKEKGRNLPLTIPQLTLAAGGAGFVTSFVLTPIELVKCKMQVQMMNFNSQPSPATIPGRIPTRRPVPMGLASIIHPPSSRSNNGTSSQRSSTRFGHDYAYNKTASASVLSPDAVSASRPPGPIALVRSIIGTYGVRGLWLGHTGTVFRETGGSAAWFVTKEWVARKLVERRRHQSISRVTSSLSGPTKLLPWESALAGAIAGGVGAVLFYPADTVKSAIQTEEELRPRVRGDTSKSRSASTFLGTFRRMYTQHGLRGLYAGCGMTVARAVPSSGIIFVVYDGLNAWFS